MPSLNQKGNILIVLALFIVVLVAASLLYFYTLKPKQVETSQPQTNYTYQTTPTSKTSLNPNTGYLYGDIKIRLKEVLK